MYNHPVPHNEGTTGTLDREAVYRELARRRWNTTKLSALADVSRATISKALNGHRIARTTLYKINQTLGLEGAGENGQ